MAGGIGAEHPKARPAGTFEPSDAVVVDSAWLSERLLTAILTGASFADPGAALFTRVARYTGLLEALTSSTFHGQAALAVI